MRNTREEQTALVRTHQAGVWRYLRFLGCDESQADDLTQETFLSVFRQPFEDRGSSATAAYLRTVAKHLFLMFLRKAQRQPTLAQQPWDDLELADQVFAQFAQTDGGNQWLEALSGCVESLDGRARQAIDLRYQADASRSAMAAALELTEDGVKTLLRRTREVLRRCVERKLES